MKLQTIVMWKKYGDRYFGASKKVICGVGWASEIKVKHSWEYP